MYKIYKIIDNTNNNIYIGITKQKYLCHRLSSHKRKKDCVAKEIIKNGDYRIELIEETDDKLRERYWIENTDCINKIIPGRTRNEWYHSTNHKEYQREWIKRDRLTKKLICEFLYSIENS